VVDIFADNPYPEGIVHGLIEEIAVKLDNVGMMLRLEQLHCFFLLRILAFKAYLILIELVERFGFDLFEGVVPVCRYVKSFVDLRVLLSGA